jgi:hypothetical protein
MRACSRRRFRPGSAVQVSWIDPFALDPSEIDEQQEDAASRQGGRANQQYNVFHDHRSATPAAIEGGVDRLD